MSSLLTAWRSEPAPVTRGSLEALLSAWPATTPCFLGKPARDPPVETWLQQIAAACSAHGIPQARWFDVARHFMGADARARLDEVERVMGHVAGQRWDWNWKSFGIAMQNMGWNIDSKKTKVVKVRRKAPFGWIILGRAGGQTVKPQNKKATGPNEPTRLIKGPYKLRAKQQRNVAGPKVTKSRSSMSKQKPGQAPSDSVLSATARRLRAMLPRSQPQPPTPTTSEIVTAQIPLWLLAASEALTSIASEHPSAMSVIAAVLITAGSIPAPAGGTVQVLGTFAVWIGALLRQQAQGTAN